MPDTAIWPWPTPCTMSPIVTCTVARLIGERELDGGARLHALGPILGKDADEGDIVSQNNDIADRKITARAPTASAMVLT